MNLRYILDRYYLVFLILVFVVLLYGLGSYGLAETSEARYAEISREMLLTGDYINPQLLGIFHFHKPPLTYYITTLGYRIFGINEFGARFFLQVAVLLQLALVYALTILLFKNRRTAFLAGLLYFSMPIVLISSRNLTTDAYLTTFIIAAIYCWQYHLEKGKLIAIYLFYVCTGLALLTKGPVALLFIITYIVTEKLIFKRNITFNKHHLAGLLLGIVLGCSWYVVVAIKNPKLWHYFIQEQLISRMTTNSFNRGKPVWYYFLLCLGLIFPWWTMIIPGLKQKLRSWPKLSKQCLVLIYSSIALFLVFSLFKTKLIFYILPMFWMVAVLIAVQLEKAGMKTRKYLSRTFLGLILTVCITVIMCWIFQLSLLNSTVFAALAALGIFIISVVVYNILDGNSVYKPALTAAGFGICLLVLSTIILQVNGSLINSTRDIAGFVNHISKAKGKTIVVDDHLLTSIPFYTPARLITLKDERNTTQRETQFENDTLWKKNLWDVKQPESLKKMDSLSKNPNSFLLLSRDQQLQSQISYIKNRYNSKKEYAKWCLYYNK